MKKIYIVPDYYKIFKCKCGECRNTCCRGWDVSIDYYEYNKILSTNCKKELKDKLDRAFSIIDRPTKEKYAVLKHNWMGDCPIMDKEGFCSLHKYCGEKTIPKICREYPRNIRSEFENECSCSNSCEAVLELMFLNKEPLQFSLIELDFVDEYTKKKDLIGYEKYYLDIRKALVKIIQDRRFSLPYRIEIIGYFLNELQNEKSQDVMVYSIIDKYLKLEKTPENLTNSDTNYALAIVNVMLSIFEENSQSIHDYAIDAQKNLELLSVDSLDEINIANSLSIFNQARLHFEELYPDWEIMFEHILVNHMFFNEFPFTSVFEDFIEEYKALCAMYGLMRFMGIAYMKDKTDYNEFIDMIAALFRLIEHSSFDKNAGIILRKNGCNDMSNLVKILGV